MSQTPAIFLALPILLGLIAAAFAANALRLGVRWIAAIAGVPVSPAALDDTFVNAAAAFLFFTLMLVAAS